MAETVTPMRAVVLAQTAPLQGTIKEQRAELRARSAIPEVMTPVLAVPSAYVAARADAQIGDGSKNNVSVATAAVGLLGGAIAEATKHPNLANLALAVGTGPACFLAGKRGEADGTRARLTLAAKAAGVAPPAR